MSGFLDRHKKKSLTALLLLLLRRWRVVTPLLLCLMIGLLALNQAGLGQVIPWADHLARALNLSSNSNDSMRQFMMLEKLLRREQAQGNSWELWSGRGVEASYLQKGSSLNMVRAGGAAGEPGPHAAYYQGRSPKTVAAIAGPEESKKYAQGVPVDAEELLAGLLKNANAGQNAGSSGAAGPAVLTRGRAVSPEDAVIPNGLRGFAGVDGGAGTAGAVGRGGPRGKLSSYGWKKAGYAITVGSPLPVISGKNTPTYNLAEVDAYSCVAAPNGVPNCPTKDYCIAGSCPGEFASHMGGAPFAGARGGGVGILSLSADPVPLTPDAQAALDRGYGSAQDEKTCVSQIKAANQQTTQQISDAFMQCCRAVNTGLSQCKASCPPFPFSLFMGCTNDCRNKANNGYRVGNELGAQACVDNYVSSYNGMAKAEDGACSGAYQAPAPINNVSATQWAQCNGGNYYN